MMRIPTLKGWGRGKYIRECKPIVTYCAYAMVSTIEILASTIIRKQLVLCMGAGRGHEESLLRRGNIDVGF